MHELVIADTWLVATLSGDATIAAAATGGVHDGNAPQGTAAPYVIIAYQSGSDVVGLGGRRVLTNPLYLVKVVGQAESYADLQPIANRVDQLLHAATGTAAGGRVLSCVRETPVKYPETKNGIPYRHLGGLYRLQVQEI